MRRIFLISVSLILPGLLLAQAHNWNSHAEVARKIMDTFDGMDSYSANFTIKTVEGRSVRNMAGKVYYKKGGKVRFDFTSPSRDFILSDGKILWIYINRIRAVGKQSLELNVQNESGRDVFLKDPDRGIRRLFSKYHYRFDTVEQPRKIDGKEYFVMDLEQREKIGGYENIKLFVDPESYLIQKAIAESGAGKVSTIEFSSIKTNPTLEGSLFNYKPDDSIRVVNNPLVNE